MTRRTTTPLAPISAILAAAAVPALAAADVHQIPLSANFNGILHAGEGGAPDDPNGYRSISDRGLDFSAGVPTGLTATGLAGSNLTYAPIADAFALDIVHLGNRNTVDSGHWAFEPLPDIDAIGVQPAWLANPDQTGPQTTTMPAPLPLNGTAQIGVIYQASNGGTNFDILLGFLDATSVTVTVNAPDWFQAASPAAPGPGLAWQETMGTFPGVGANDLGSPSEMLNVVEAVITAEDVLSQLGFDMSGKSLTSVTFQNSVCTMNACGVAVFALSVDDGQGLAPDCTVDLDDSGDVDVFDLLAYLDGWFAGCP